MRTHPLWRPFHQPSDEENAAARVNAPRPTRPVEVVAPDPRWPDLYAGIEARVRSALGDRVLAIEHVGSTAVPGLWAKPMIDADLTVADAAREEEWVPELVAAGFVLRLREPDFEQHRMMRLDDPACNLHVWSPGSSEVRRHVMFRDWLAAHPDDRALYESTKRAVAAEGHLDAMHYNNRKGDVVYDIYERIFAADPAYPHDPHPRAT